MSAVQLRPWAHRARRRKVAGSVFFLRKRGERPLGSTSACSSRVHDGPAPRLTKRTDCRSPDALRAASSRGRPDSLELVGFKLSRSLRWTRQGKEANALPYWDAYGSRIVIRDGGRIRLLRVRVMITWRRVVRDSPDADAVGLWRPHRIRHGAALQRGAGRPRGPGRATRPRGQAHGRRRG